MSRNNSSLKYQIQEKANITAVTHANTRKQYKKSCAKFWGYCKSEGIKNVNEISIITIQSYANNLSKYGYSPSTIHAHVTVSCKVLRVRSDRIIKPKRTSDKICKSRGKEKNKQGRREEKQDRFKRLVEFQNMVGIRRSELAKLSFDCLKDDESGYPCIQVLRGKGGKNQMQRILPGDVDQVKSIIMQSNGCKVFSALEMNNKIDLHKIRANHAKVCYGYYMDRLTCDELYRKQLENELMFRYDTCNTHEGLRAERAREHFLKEMQGLYRVRGNNARIAKENGLQIEYDRLALMAVSVFQLSHWRMDVTVTNYMMSW